MKRFVYLIVVLLLAVPTLALILATTVWWLENSTMEKSQAAQSNSPQNNTQVEPPKVEIPLKQPEGTKIPIGGITDAWLVRQDNGLVWLVRDNGYKELVAEPEQEPAEDKINEAVTKIRPSETVQTQIIVLDKGLVAIPRTSMVTYRGPDYVVTISHDGHTIAYGIDGEIKLRN